IERHSADWTARVEKGAHTDVAVISKMKQLQIVLSPDSDQVFARAHSHSARNESQWYFGESGYALAGQIDAKERQALIYSACNQIRARADCCKRRWTEVRSA